MKHPTESVISEHRILIEKMSSFCEENGLSVSASYAWDRSTIKFTFYHKKLKASYKQYIYYATCLELMFLDDDIMAEALIIRVSDKFNIPIQSKMTHETFLSASRLIMDQVKGYDVDGRD